MEPAESASDKSLNDVLAVIGPAKAGYRLEPVVVDHENGLVEFRAAGELMPSAVEELLRFCSPVAASTVRFAAADVSLCGVVIPKGEMVLVIIAAANRDPVRFSLPDVLDLARPDRRHLTFGHGIHYCLVALPVAF